MRQQYRTLTVVSFVEFKELFERKIANNITIEHEKQTLLVSIPQYGLS